MTPVANWLSITQACAYVNVSRRTIYNWLTAGRLEYTRTAGGSIRINPDSLYRPIELPAPATPSAAAPSIAELCQRLLDRE
jgi:excisionase family DNA binding protein